MQKKQTDFLPELSEKLVRLKFSDILATKITNTLVRCNIH